jgi:hypothetical protein
MAFQKATKKKAKLRMSVDGPPGSGKTYTALTVAGLLGDKVAVIDSEYGSASKYADKFEFDTLELPDHRLERYIAAIQEAAAAGYPVLIIDSLSHAWNGKGGALETVDKLKSASKSKNAFTEGWSAVTPLQHKLFDAILSYPGHVICTLRTKMAYEIVGGQPKKIGLAPVQRDGVEYEFDIAVSLTHNGMLSVGKSRCPSVPVGMNAERTDAPELTRNIVAWLSDGVEPPAAPAPSPLGEPSEEEKMLVRIDECRSVEDLKSLVSAIKSARLDSNETVRAAYSKRQAHLSNTPRAEAVA